MKYSFLAAGLSFKFNVHIILYFSWQINSAAAAAAKCLIELDLKERVTCRSLDLINASSSNCAASCTRFLRKLSIQLFDLFVMSVDGALVFGQHHQSTVHCHSYT